MPFSRQNIKFTTLVIGFVLMVTIGVVGVVAISYSPKSDSTPLYTAVTGFVTLAAGQLLVLLRTEQLHTEIDKTQGAVTEDRHTTERVEEKVESMDRKLNGGVCPASADELAEKLRPVITRIVEDVCKRIAEDKPK